MRVIKVINSFPVKMGMVVVGLVLAHYGDTVLALIGGMLFLVALLSGDLSDVAKKPVNKPVDGWIKSLYKEEDVAAFFAKHGLSVSNGAGPFGRFVEISNPKTHEFVYVCKGHFYKVRLEI